MENVRKERSQCSDRQGGIELVSYERERESDRETETERDRQTETEAEADRT